ncbi:MAG: lipocalin family protein [Wenzhouxiangellaceae bacterium]|nr:lipocalin family protein [Wenzhouxiangellaceae bacterium]
MKRLAGLFGLFWLVLPGARAEAPLDLVDALDLERYQGLWYEIALLPNRFQDQCVGETTAQYTLEDGGAIRVINRCRTADGDFTQAIGRARRPDSSEPARLEVRFAPRWLSWLPFVWGDYQVMALDSGYRWVMVGNPSREYLWVLARTPQLSEDTLQALLAEAAAQGFDIERVQRTRQEWP